MSAAAGEVPIEVVPLEQARESDVLIERILLPPSVPKDSAFDARLLVQSSEGGPPASGSIRTAITWASRTSI
jgi:hypothetical protein